MNNNEEFIDLLDYINNAGRALSFKNGIQWAEYACNLGVIDYNTFKQYENAHNLRVRMAHGNARDINISIQTLNIARRYKNDISKSKVRNNGQSFNNGNHNNHQNSSSSEEMLAVEEIKKIEDEMVRLYELGDYTAAEKLVYKYTSEIELFKNRFSYLEEKERLRLLARCKYANQPSAITTYIINAKQQQDHQAQLLKMKDVIEGFRALMDKQIELYYSQYNHNCLAQLKNASAYLEDYPYLNTLVNTYIDFKIDMFRDGSSEISFPVWEKIVDYSWNEEPKEFLKIVKKDLYENNPEEWKKLYEDFIKIRNAKWSDMRMAFQYHGPEYYEMLRTIIRDDLKLLD